MGLLVTGSQSAITVRAIDIRWPYPCGRLNVSQGGHAKGQEMRAKNHTRLTPRERLSRGLASTAVGPVDVTRGLVGLGVHSAQAGASSVRRRYREGRLAHDLHSAQEALVQELAAALGAPPACGGEVVTG